MRFRFPDLLAAAFLVAIPLGATGATAAATAVRIGTEADDAPFETIGPDGTLHGFDIDIGDALCARAGLRCTWVNMDFDGLIPALGAHRIDAAMSQISVTPARARAVLFTLPVSTTVAVIVAPTGSTIRDAATASLKGHTIGVQSGTTHETYAKSVLGAAVTLQVYQSQQEAFADLDDGRIDATLCDGGVAAPWIAHHPGFAIRGKPVDDPAVFGTGTAIALRPGDTSLRAAFDGALRSMLADGSYAAINRRYLPFSVAPHLPG